MSENAETLSFLNDFIFCPVSIYFHNLDYDTEKMSYQSEKQIDGSAAHKKWTAGNIPIKKVFCNLILYIPKNTIYTAK